MPQTSKTVLITGAGRGIGLALAEVFLENGWSVVATVRDHGRDKALAALGQKHEGRLRLLLLDILQPETLVRAGRELSAAPVDILINNAGIIGPERQSTLDTDFNGFATTLEVNTLGPLRVTQAFLPSVRAARAVAGVAKVVTISSAMGSLSYAKSDHIAYRTSKAAVNKVMQGLATDLAAENIAVFTVHPGWVRTDMGGADADIDVRTSAEGIYAEITRRGLTETGTFFDYAGTTVAW